MLGPAIDISKRSRASLKAPHGGISQSGNLLEHCAAGWEPRGSFVDVEVDRQVPFSFGGDAAAADNVPEDLAAHHRRVSVCYAPRWSLAQVTSPRPMLCPLRRWSLGLMKPHMEYMGSLVVEQVPGSCEIYQRRFLGRQAKTCPTQVFRTHSRLIANIAHLSPQTRGRVQNSP